MNGTGGYRFLGFGLRLWVVAKIEQDNKAGIRNKSQLTLSGKDNKS